MRVCCVELQVVAKLPSWASTEYGVWIADRQFTCRTLNGSGVELSGVYSGLGKKYAVDVDFSSFSSSFLDSYLYHSI
jgi:hypothetical protein